MPERPLIPFFTDHNVPDSVGDALIAAGHQVTRLRDVMETKTPDPVIAVACASSGQVLISHDADFRQVAKRLQITQRQYQKSLHRIRMRCPEYHSARRIVEELPIIELEWLRRSVGNPLVIEITDVAIRVVR